MGGGYAAPAPRQRPQTGRHALSGVQLDRLYGQPGYLRGLGALEGLRRDPRVVGYQSGRCGHPVRVRRRGRADQRALHHPGFAQDDGGFPLGDPGLLFRQRAGVHQLPAGGDAGEAALVLSLTYQDRSILTGVEIGLVLKLWTLRIEVHGEVVAVGGFVVGAHETGGNQPVRPAFVFVSPSVSNWA